MKKLGNLKITQGKEGEEVVAIFNTLQEFIIYHLTPGNRTLLSIPSSDDMLTQHLKKEHANGSETSNCVC